MMSGFRRRLLIIASTMCLLFLLDIASLFKLQVIDADKYFVLSEKNRIRTRPIFPTRGEIYDRKGTKIAVNVPVYRLMLINTKKRKSVIDSVNKLREIIDIKLDDKEIISKSIVMPLNSYICIKDYDRLKNSQTCSKCGGALKRVIEWQGIASGSGEGWCGKSGSNFRR